MVGVNNVNDSAEIRQVGRSLRKRRFDVAIVEHPSAYGYRIGHEARPAFCIGWNAKGFGYLCSHPITDDRSAVRCIRPPCRRPGTLAAGAPGSFSDCGSRETDGTNNFKTKE